MYTYIHFSFLKKKMMNRYDLKCSDIRVYFHIRQYSDCDSGWRPSQRCNDTIIKEKNALVSPPRPQSCAEL